MRVIVPSICAALFAFCAESARAQLPPRSPSKFYPDSSDPAEKVLRNAAGHARNQQWAEAVELYQRVIDQFGGKVTKVPREEPGQDAAGEFALYVDARRFCHHAVAQLPVEAREIYRNRVDAVAEPWFRQGQLNRDEAALRRVIDQAFCSSFGDEAIELLADMVFQDGRFGEALGLYRLLVADRSDDAFALVHPDPTVDLAKVAAKKLLCRAALGENVPTRGDVDELARQYPGAAGALAGRTGAYADIVAEALAVDHLAPSSSQPDSRWPTFAGSQRRSKIVAGPIDVGSTQWRVELEKVQPGRSPPTFGTRMVGGGTPAAPDRLLAFHPIILGDQVIVTDGARVLAYNLNDRPVGPEGSVIRSVEPAWKHERDTTTAGPQATRFSPGIPRFTLTAVGNRIYARMGGMTTTYYSRMEGFTARGANSIVALDWSTQGKLLWEQKSTSIVLPNRPADRAGNRSVSFEGTPVADARNVYVALTDRSTQIATYVACYEAETGAPRWIRYLGSASADTDNFPAFGMGFPFGPGPGDFNHRLLSLEGPTLYYQTNLGAVVALEAETGTTLWVGTYPRQESNHLGGGAGERDLNPAVVDDGRVFVAPSDSDAIYAFDAGNGRLCWRSDPVPEEAKLTHLLGVARGKLVATGNRVLLFDVKTGKLVHAWPDSGGPLEAYGRGLLAGDLIYWPTKNEIQVLDQQTALQVQPPIRLQETYHVKGGNLAAGDGYLIVAQADGLVVFCQNSRLIERFRDAIALAPDDASNYFRLAKAAEALGRDQDALQSYREAARKARSNQTIDGVPLASSSRDHLFRLLIRLAAEARRGRRWQECVDRLESAFEAARSDPDRLQSELLLVDVLIEAGRARDAVAVCGRVLGDDRLRPLAVVTPDGHRSVRADLFITDRLQSIVRAAGRSVYAADDQEAAQMFERGKRQRDPRTLDEVCRRYPVAQIVPEALSELGALYQASGRMGEATYVYKRLLSLGPDDQSRASALWHLARVYEARKLYLSARDTYAELLARYPRALAADRSDGKTVSEIVRAELARSPYALLDGDRLRPLLPMPLFRRWQWQPSLNQEAKALCAEGVAPSLDASRMLLVEREGIRLLDPRTGLPRWFAEMSLPVVWAAYSADKIVVASRREIVALDLAQGSTIWRYGTGAAGKSQARVDPFENPKAEEKNDHASLPRPRDLLTDLQVKKGRLFFLRGQHDLVALDVDTGAVDWTFASPPREINANLTIGDDRIWMQVDKPNELWVLRTDDGQMLSRHSLGENEFLRRPPVPFDEDTVLLVPDLLTVKKFDTAHGQATWMYRESDNLPVNGPPCVYSDGERVLVLHDGLQLIRLDPTTGSKRWSIPVGMENLSERQGAMAFDDKRFYVAAGRVPRASSGKILRAISLEDGSPVWSSYLSGPDDATWSIALAGEHVLAYPGKSDATQGNEVDIMCVVVRRKETGALVQRFVFPTTIADVAFKADPRGVWVATTRGLWALGKRDGGSSPVSAASGR